MAMETVSVMLPASWASALVNNDWSGIEYDGPAEAQKARQWQATSGLRVLGCEDEYCARFDGVLTMVCDYICVPAKQLDLLDKE